MRTGDQMTEGDCDGTWVATAFRTMIRVEWPQVVAGLSLVTLLRPVLATLSRRQEAQAEWRQQDLCRAGGGAAMLAVSIWLVTESSRVTGQGYWQLALLGLRDPFWRSMPIVWVPTMCWVLLALPGSMMLYLGVKGSRGPRQLNLILGAANEIAIFTGLLFWGAYLPNDWEQAELINFALQAFYLGSLVGAVLRLWLVLLGPARGAPLEATPAQPEGKAWLGRLRRF